MIYPVVKRHSVVVNHYVLPAAVGAGLGVGSRVFIQNHNVNKDKFDKDSKNLGLAGAAIGGAGGGIYASGAIRGDRSDKNLGKVIGLPGVFVMNESNRRLKQDVKKQSLTDALLLPSVGAAVGVRKGY